jgi:poly-gamma-glutamate capsule biosynthesis protein CapA/YwtB (metallophosphatase superfamily)
MRPGRLLIWGVAALLAFCANASASRLPSVPAGKSVTLEWVGDIAMSTELGLPPGGVQNALAPVAPLLHGADITFGNLEGTLSAGDSGSKCGSSVTGNNCFAFQAPPSYAHGLRALGFRLVNQANNHSMDFGASGRSQTITALKSAGIAETGYPGQITYLSTHGIKVAFLGFGPYQYDADLLDIPAAEALVRTARQNAALVVVIIHAGAEGAQYDHVPAGDQTYLGEDRGNARAFAHGVIAAGASLVVGSGPHVIRGVEDYQGHMVAYSLGNFVGYHTLGGTGIESDSAILRVTLGAGGKVVAGDWIPVELDNGLPRPDPSDASAHLVASLSDQDFPHDHFQILGTGQFKLPR